MIFKYINLKVRIRSVLFKIGAIALGLLICNVFLSALVRHPKNVLDYFPEAKGDGSRITWFHGTNNRHSLEEALRSNTMILEAHISSVNKDGTSIPVMALPPTTASDLTLDQWLREVVKFHKGIKLTFKHLDAISPSIEILQKYIDDIKLPVILYADILPGPTNPISAPLQAAPFLDMVKRLPYCRLTVGWTTFLDPTVPLPIYTRNMIDAMTAVLNNANVKQLVTFSVRACIAKNSIAQLKYLLSSFPHSTLAVWSRQGDPIAVTDLMNFRKHFNLKHVYYDLSSPLREEFLQSISQSKS